MDPRARPTGGRAEVVPLRRRGADALDAVDGRRRDAPDPLVLRRRLFERLAEPAPVTIVSGPAGSRKTWLLRSWIAELV
ncbi:MAG: hypothetical protein ACXW08_05555 [Solirubrobacteraceae bacterium]